MINEKSNNIEERFIGDDVTSDQAWNILTTFLLKVSDQIDYDKLTEKENNNYFHFFYYVIGFNMDPSVDWNRAIFKVTDIAPRDQKPELTVNLQTVFLLITEFCKIAGDELCINLRLLIDMLEGMIKEPESFKAEWNLWKESLLCFYKGDYYGNSLQKFFG